MPLTLAKIKHIFKTPDSIPLNSVRCFKELLWQDDNLCFNDHPTICQDS